MVSPKIPICIEFHAGEFDMIQQAAARARMGVTDFAALAVYRAARDDIQNASPGLAAAWVGGNG